MKEPLVSVLMTAYNRESYIAEAIESVLASTYKNFELIVVDDGSQDKTVAIVKEFQQKDSRISVYVNTKNLGDYPNRNKASSYAQGTYIMYVDSDDKLYPFSIHYCVNQMMENKYVDLGMLCKDEYLCGKTLTARESIPYHFFTKSILYMGPGGTIIKRSFFEAINKYPEKYGPSNDMYFNLKAASQGKIKFLCKEFLFYRIHEGQEQNNKESYLYNNHLYFMDAIKELDLPISLQKKEWLIKKAKRRFTVNIMSFFFRTFNAGKTRNIIKQAKFSFSDFVQGIFH
jgi:glycosyltransferase involved in cell wall biosynthesis